LIPSNSREQIYELFRKTKMASLTPTPKEDANDYSRFESLDDPDEESKLDRAKTEKDEGNRLFKAADFEGAIARYTEVCQILKIPKDDTKKKQKKDEEETSIHVAALSNRAACHLKLRNFKRAIEDCNAILKQDAKHAKALFRRSQAHTSKGMNEMAYRDVLLLLDFDPSNKAALKSKKKLEKDLHTRSRDAIRSRIEKDKREAAEKLRKKAEKERKARMKEEEKIRIAERLANAFPSSTSSSSSSSPIKMAPPTKIYVSRDDIVKDTSTESGELMRGYKKTKDGKTTSYFTRELDEKAKALLGDTAPKKLSSTTETARPVERKTSTSAWNSAGTYEEKDRTQFCTNLLKELVSEVTVEDGEYNVKVTGTKKIEGDGSMLVVRGSLRFIWDYSFSISYKISLTENNKKCKGTLRYVDFTQDEKEPPTVSNSVVGVGFKDADDKAKGNRATAVLRARMEEILLEFRKRCMAEIE
jgi:tetratricopeptide (TPR) repeat protein